jgi:hypothetical protein
MAASLKTAIERLRHELQADGGGCGPGCPPSAVRCPGWVAGSPGSTLGPDKCPRCGRPARVVEVVFDDDWFRPPGRADEP